MECGQNGKTTLRAAPKASVDGAVGLAPQEDRLLREAFGRYGGTARGAPRGGIRGGPLSANGRWHVAAMPLQVGEWSQCGASRCG